MVDKILTRAASRVADDVPDGSDPRIAVIWNMINNHAILIPADPYEAEEYLNNCEATRFHNFALAVSMF